LNSGPENMRLTFVLPPFSPKPIGGLRVIYEYCNRLVDHEYQVSIVHLLGLDGNALAGRGSLRHLASRIRRAVSPPNLWWQDLDRRIKVSHIPAHSLTRIPKGDAIFATAWTTARPVLESAVSNGVKFYFVQDFDPYIASKEILETTWRWPLKKITVSNWLRDRVLASGAPPEDTINIPNAIDHSRFRLLRGIADRPRQISMFYGSANYKTPEVGLAALELAKRQHPEIQVTAFGHGPRPEGPFSWVDYRRNLPESDLVRLYNDSQIFVCSSAAEGFALPPAEAAACGCAIVSTDCGGIREYAENESNALLSPPNDSRALAGNILRLLDDESLRQRFASAGLNRIQEFKWERSTRLLEDFIERSCAERDSRLSKGSHAGPSNHSLASKTKS